MKAYSLFGINDLRYIDDRYPDCPSGWCIIKVKAAGICSSDIPRIFSKGTYHFPTIPGHEFSGVVADVADNENKGLLGKKVSVFPLIPCRKCKQCLLGHYEMCADYDYIGSRRNGAFAEYVAVPVWNLVVMSNHIPFEQAALMEPLSVALHAVKQGQIKRGDVAAVVGTGMIGLAAAQWALKMGAKEVVVIGHSEDKRPLVESIGGLTYEVSGNNTDEYDLVIEAVGSNQSVIQAVYCVRPGGRLVLMGNPEGDIVMPQNIYWGILRKQIIVSGTWNSVYSGTDKSDWTETADALSNRKIEAAKLISHRFQQKKLEEGLEIMRRHSEPYLRIVTLWNEERENAAR